jgi:hypothetical protein
VKISVDTLYRIILELFQSCKTVLTRPLLTGMYLKGDWLRVFLYVGHYSPAILRTVYYFDPECLLS